MTTPETGGAPAPPISWSWHRALAGALFALPAAAVALSDPSAGIPLAVGVLPAAILPMPPRRKARLIILIVGVLAGASLFVGGVLAHLPTWAAALLLAATVVAAAYLTTRVRAAQVLLVLGAPLVAAGLSYDDYASSFSTFLLLSLGAAYAWLVSLAWPEREAVARPEAHLPLRRPMLDYGIRMGTAAGIAYLVTSGLGLDHPGWAPAACLLVARPQLDLLQSRGVGRVLAVIVGATAAALTLQADPVNALYALAALTILGAAAATAGSRWYITSGFTTYFVFLMLVRGHPDEAITKFNERIGETILGVALAYVFGWLLPLTTSKRRTTSPMERASE